MWFGCVLEAQATRGPGSVDGRAAASADTSHYSWPSFKIKVSIARTEPCLASLWLPTPTP